MSNWLNPKVEMFENRLHKVFKHRKKIAFKQAISCYRVYDHDLPEFPFSIDIYEDVLYIAEYARRHELSDEEYERWKSESFACIEKVIGIPQTDFFVKERKRNSHRSGSQYEKLDDEQSFKTVEEGGLKFLVNLTNYLDTGLFLDHRITRQMVREKSEQKDVLNLFAYTGSFSVYAASGKAKSVTTVDLSKTYLNWAKDNLQINLFKGNQYQFIHADVKEYLKDIKANSYDLIIMDPPTFSNSKRMKDFLDIQIDHPFLINQCLHALRKGGLLYFSTNFTKFQLQDQLLKSSSIKNITAATTPFDFQGKLQRWCFLIEK